MTTPLSLQTGDYVDTIVQSHPVRVLKVQNSFIFSGGNGGLVHCYYSQVCFEFVSRTAEMTESHVDEGVVLNISPVL